MLLSMVISAQAAIGIAVTELWMALTQGPNMMYLVSRSMSQSRAAGLISLAGTGVGFVAYMTMVNVGLAVVFVSAVALHRAQGRRCRLSGESRMADVEAGRSRLVRNAGPCAGLVGESVSDGPGDEPPQPQGRDAVPRMVDQFIDPFRGNTTAQGFALGGIQINVGLIVNGLIVVAVGAIASQLMRRPS
ncbi:LysE family translocator [Rhodococcus sp. 311R]|uniref:LysE family translocator n=1 Tax=Rhodococcus sp. 311R TaxID=1617904 RepID=UPI003FD2766F